MTPGPAARALAHALLILFLPLLAAPTVAAEATHERVVILGFDGADAAITRRLLEQGKLPNLARLRERGAFASLGTTNPPQTPVSWSSFATGLDPGRTTIFDFLKRQPRTYIPTFALMEEGKETFLAGERNGALGAAIGAGLGLLLVGLPLVWKLRSRGLALVIAAAAASSLGVAGFRGFDRLLPKEIPSAINNRQGETMWDLAAAAGLRTKIIRVPATFPATPVPDGEFLSGLGVPDIRGTVGTFSYYTTERLERGQDTEFGGKIVELEPFTASTESVVYGPRNKLFYKPDPKTHLDPEGDPREINLPLKLTRQGDRVALEVPGHSQVLAAGEWSDWIVFDFPFNQLISLKGFGRFHLIEAEPLKLYLSPINLHPDKPPVPFSSPPDFAMDLHREHGFYKTLGWSEDTWSYTEKRVDEALFLGDVAETVAKEEEIMMDLITGDDWDLFVQVFTFTDRIAHVFWRLTDPEHPAYDAELAARWGDQIDLAYQRMDELVGKAMDVVGDDPRTLFLVVSDHGFATWRRSVNINTWLVKNGYMTLHTRLGGRQLTLEDLFNNKKFWPYVDWSRTRAYALGLGNVYINVAGREPSGIVEPGAEYDQLVAALTEGLEALTDDERGGADPIRRVYHRDDIYGTFDNDLIPDLRVANNPGYRVSWQSSLGATPKDVFEDNDKPWSADHCSLDPAAVPGILFSSASLDRADPRMIDVMPTVLGALGVATPDDLDGAPFQ